MVSIHASAREATLALEYQAGGVVFQSTPPHGRRRARAGGISGKVLFQSTPPHGRRLSYHKRGRFIHWFQSTPPHGRRLDFPLPEPPRITGFNPRLRTGGDRKFVHRASGARSCFNPRLRTGGDADGVCPGKADRSFNPRLRTGGDSTVKHCVICHRLFQSTPPHGRRRKGARLKAISVLFQSTPPHGRRQSNLP